ncbi:MAG: universal stress protein [Thermoanaerobaculia bacterium]|nr:universal stress protein [Thermoanaerobaculia bacterium]
MFSRILVPVDLTAKNRVALDAACRLLAPAGELVLLHVVERLADDAAESEGFYAALDRRAREVLRELGDIGRRSGARVREELVLGHRVEEIVTAASREGSDLVVLASHRLDPERPFADGLSLSYRVALLLPCPVLLVK